jgi:hypothetical protein
MLCPAAVCNRSCSGWLQVATSAFLLFRGNCDIPAAPTDLTPFPLSHSGGDGGSTLFEDDGASVAYMTGGNHFDGGAVTNGLFYRVAKRANCVAIARLTRM